MSNFVRDEGRRRDRGQGSFQAVQLLISMADAKQRDEWAKLVPTRAAFGAVSGIMWRTFAEAFTLLGSLDASVLQIAGVSVYVSTFSTLVASVLGFPLGAVVALSTFRGRSTATAVLNASLGLPPVLAGLFVYLLLSRSGPFGAAGLLFTPAAMIIAQTLLITPLVGALSRQIVEEADLRLGEQLRSMRLTLMQRVAAILFDTRHALIVVVLAAFGRAIAEVGAVIVAGGNIAGYTRTMTTAISLETQKGDLPLALALGIVLIGIAGVVNIAGSLLRAYVARTYG
jgi:tungstate transport system permease protein